MNRKWFLAWTLLGVGAITVAVTMDVNHPLLNNHISKLKGANTLTVNFTFNKLGTDVEDHKLVLSKGGLLRWETSDSLVVANGSQILTLDKKTNQYTEEPQTPESLKKVLNSDAIWAWSAFADDTFLKPITDAKTGAARKVKGTAVKELNVARGPKVVTLFIDDQLGFARGATYQVDNGIGQKNTFLIVASEIVVGKDALTSTDKQFAAPTGAQKVEKLAAGTSWKDVGPIFAARCGCHVSRVTAGLSLASHRGIMSGSRSGQVVTPGDPENSVLLQVIKGTRAPKMPPQGELTPQQLETLSNWIKDGAKE